ncbi:MAG: hypothetical protein ACO1SX_09115 [Actinomycetota bacterium]
MREGVLRDEAGKTDSKGYVAPAIGSLEQTLYFTTAPSVTEKAKQVLDQGRLRVPGAVVVWNESIGRRKGAKAEPKAWWADSGSLSVAFALESRPELRRDERLARMAAAVLRVVAAFQPQAAPSFREPNDLLIGGGKFGAIYYEPHAGVDLAIIRLNCVTDLQSAPAAIADHAVRLIDFIDAGQLPLGQAGTLPNTLLTRLMTEIPRGLGAA